MERAGRHPKHPVPQGAPAEAWQPSALAEPAFDGGNRAATQRQVIDAIQLSPRAAAQGAVLARIQDSPRMASPLQRKWAGEERDTVRAWDKPVDGLIWYWNTLTQKLHYKISGSTPFPLHIVEGQAKPFTYEEWKAAGWSGTVDEEAEAKPKAEAEPKTEKAPARSDAPASAYKGAFRAFDSLDHAGRDPEFDAVMADVPEGSPDVVIGVLDTGIITKSEYLHNKVIGASDSALPAKMGKPKSGEEYQKDIQDLHGTRVAGNAGFGSEKIKLLDVRVQVGQINGYDNSEEIAAGIQWAVGKGARVITSSVALDWGKKAIQAAVDKHPEVLFLTSGGNNDAKLETRSIDADPEAPRSNAMLVGGVTMEGKKHPKRGYGPAVDVSVPSGASSDDERALSTHVPKAVTASQMLPGLQEDLARARRGHEQDLAAVKKAAANPVSLARAEKRALDSGKEVTRIERETATWKSYEASAESDVAGESGVSFGLPVVANIAAKMLIINPALTPSEIREMMMKNVTTSKELAALSKARGMVDPEKCYAAAKASRR